jgi:hypothetical protein
LDQVVEPLFLHVHYSLLVLLFPKGLELVLLLAFGLLLRGNVLQVFLVVSQDHGVPDALLLRRELVDRILFGWIVWGNISGS